MTDKGDKRSKPQGSKKKGSTLSKISYLNFTDEDEMSDFENDPEFQKLNEIERETKIAEHKER